MRKVRTIIEGRPTLEGAGVKLRRLLGPFNIPLFDPFLLLDHFGSENPEDYVKGFPWHPHRGIETVTYMIQGEVEHGDSIGNTGIIRSGDIQWMPKRYNGSMMGFQLWVNLPRNKKMTDPRYRGLIAKDLVTVQKNDYEVVIIAGTFDTRRGPVQDLFVDVEYFDVHLSGEFFYSTKKRTAFLYVYDGSIMIGDSEIPFQHGALLEDKGDLQIQGKGKFLCITGDPLMEPIAWGGPIVMNTQEELQKAFDELNKGTFLKGPLPAHVAKEFYQ